MTTDNSGSNLCGSLQIEQGAACSKRHYDSTPAPFFVWRSLKAPAQNSASAVSALCCVCYSSSALSLFLHTIHMSFVYVRMRKQASISRVVLGVGRLDFWDIPATWSFRGGVSMRGEHGREGSGCDDDPSALAGHLKGLRSSAVTAEVTVAAATCRANSHRLSGIAQHSCSFEYLLTPRQRAIRTYIKNVPVNYCAWPATYRSAYFSKMCKYLNSKKKRNLNILTKLTTDIAVFVVGPTYTLRVHYSTSYSGVLFYLV